MTSNHVSGRPLRPLIEPTPTLATDNMTLTLINHLKLAGWLPESQEALDNYLEEKLKKVSSTKTPFLRVIQNFQNLIESDPEVYMGFVQMYKEAKGGKVKNYHELLALLNDAIRTPPKYEPGQAVPGLPIYLALFSVIITPAGFNAFTNRKVNAQFKSILDSWGNYLQSVQSAEVLTEDPQTGGWLSPDAIKQFAQFLPKNDFVAAFECDPRLPHWGFTSWDNFFIRPYRKGVRPLEDSTDPNVINNACESTVFFVKSGAEEYSDFWLKGEKYSLRHMLNDDVLASELYGGTVYQAFLSSVDYHRWHSPVTGVVERCYVVPGTYYALSPSLMDDPKTLTGSQSFLSAVATRALIFIRSDNPAIGLVCLIAVGMIEVSTCDLTVGEGQRINRGEQLGMFHFGGSTHCLVFGPKTKFEGSFPDIGTHVPLRSKLIKVIPKNA